MFKIFFAMVRVGTALPACSSLAKRRYNVLIGNKVRAGGCILCNVCSDSGLIIRFPWAFGVGLTLVMVALVGCRTAAPLPQVNLTDPGWNVRHGQAIWRPPRAGNEIAGELLLATGTNNAAFVEFIKTPFPMVVAQQTRTSWQIEFPTGKIRYGGQGKPPGRLIWFWLIQAMSGKSLPKNWLWHQDKNSWRLENRATGESLEGYFREPVTFRIPEISTVGTVPRPPFTMEPSLGLA